MQVYPINNTIFSARIVPSEYLNKAIDLAKQDAASGTKQGIDNASKFYNSLRTIELDGSKKELSISDADKSLPPVVRLDGTKFFVETYKDVENKTAVAVQDAINTLADSKYFQGEMRNDASKVDLKYAFDVWRM